MNGLSNIVRPETLRAVAEQSNSLPDFGMNVRDWQHTIQRGGVHSRSALGQRIDEPPPRLTDSFKDGDIADAYLAAYAEWLADQAGIPRPVWCGDPQRCARDPWFSTPVRGYLLVVTPASFRHRNLFTVPENVFTPKAGRPRSSSDHKRKKAKQRQKTYRDRVRLLLAKARAAEVTVDATKRENAVQAVAEHTGKVTAGPKFVTRRVGAADGLKRSDDSYSWLVIILYFLLHDYCAPISDFSQSCPFSIFSA